MENIDFKHVNDNLPRYGEDFDYGGQESNWCVYVHINKINEKKYVGVSSNLKKRWSRDGEDYIGCDAIYNAFNCYGWDNFDHIVLMNGLTKDMADMIEKELIAKYKTYAETQEGYNIAHGGLGGTFIDRSFSYVPVHQYDLQGRYIQSFDSLTQAETLINGENTRGHIANCLNENGYGYGFLWSRELLDCMPSYDTIVKKKNSDIRIACYDPNTNEIKFYKDVYNISDDKTYRARVMKCCRNNQKNNITVCDNKYWFFSDDFQNIDIEQLNYHYNNKYKKVKPVYMFKDGILIKSFKSALEANKETGINFANILSVCHGRRKSMGGYQWSFENTL